jgi:hypothetical protein
MVDVPLPISKYGPNDASATYSINRADDISANFDKTRGMKIIYVEIYRIDKYNVFGVDCKLV